MTLGRLHRSSMTAVAVLAILGVVSGSVTLGLAGAALSIVMLLASGRLLTTTRGRSEAFLVHGVTLAGVLFAAAIFRTARVDSVFLILLLGLFNRFMLRGGQRDDLLVIGVSAALMAGATTVTPGIEFLLLILGFVPALTWSLLTSMLLGSAERAGLGSVASAMGRAVPRVLVRRMAWLGLALAIGGALTVSLLPRYRFSQTFAPGAYAALSGAASSMETDGNAVTESGSNQLVLRVTRPDGRPPGPESTYVRLYSLDKFDGRVWSRSSEGHFRFEVATPGPSTEVLTVNLEKIPGTGEHHPIAAIGIDRPLNLMAPESATTAGLRAIYGVHEEQSGGWVVDRMNLRSAVYDVVIGSTVVPARRADHYAEASEQLQRQVPAGLDPRILELGRQLTENGTPTEKIRNVMNHLSRGFRYSLGALKGESKDPLARFLFEDKAGHCELYASALATLLRVGGLRTRVATGFYVGDWNGLGGYQGYSAQNAHAWVEVYLDGEWRWFDATPPDLRRVEQVGVLAQLRDVYDALSAAWFDNVVDFDGARQRKLYEALADRFSAPMEAIAPSFETSGASGGSEPRSAGLGFLLLPALGALAYGTHVRRTRLEYLGERLRRALGASRSETLGRKIVSLPIELRAQAEAVSSSYEALRFGGLGQRSEVAKGIRELEVALRKKGRERSE